VRRKIVYSQHADADLERLEAFIAAESRRQAARAIARILRGLRNLQRFPELGKDVGDGFRQLILRHGKGGYVIRYRVLDEAILVTRIWHGKEDRPG
jgi:plasmid stabilization system protein ParE